MNIISLFSFSILLLINTLIKCAKNPSIDFIPNFRSQIIIDINKVTNEMMSILNNYAKELEEICNKTIYNGEWEDFYIVGEIIE